MIYDMEEELDDSWINEFQKNDEPYNELYKDDIFTINLNFLYINKENNIEKIKEEIFFMQNPNVISREEIIQLIKHNSTVNNNNYSLLSIIKYNITLNPEDITTFLTNDFDSYNEKFFIILKHIDTIVFDKTILTLQDLNTLFIIFYEKDKMELRNNSISNNNTKKIYWKPFKGKNRKTIRRN
jgi:hypothetical protein